MFKWLFIKSPRKIIQEELEESNRLLLQAHTNKEHWESQVAYHQTKIKRLTSSWNKLQQDEEKEKEKKND